MTTATFQNGNKEITISVVGSHEWSAAGNARIYFDLKCTGKRNPVNKLYEVVEGTTRNNTITQEGRVFAFEYGVDAGSKSKRAAIKEAISEIIKSL